MQRIVIELKLKRGELEGVIAKGLEQTADYADRVGAHEAHLVIFDRDPTISWETRIWQTERHYAERRIGIWGA